VRGYSAGAQKVWLERELAAARRDPDIDWLVICMHQVAISTADMFNGADLGIRQEWLPLFDQYGVDLVVCGHEHHYERSHPLRGRQANATLTPIPTATATDVIDTTKGTVHMVIGGGGTSGSVESAVLQSTGMPRHHRRRRARCGHRQAPTDLREGGRAVVGRAQRRALVRLRRIQPRPGIPTWRLDHDHRHVLRRGRERRRPGAVRNVYAAPAASRLSQSAKGSGGGASA
jgi:3',5'-cyclic AMP phosphodiesterase CpdA